MKSPRAYEHYPFACEIIKEKNICYGMSVNHFRKVQWVVDLDTKEVEIHHSLAGSDFIEDLLSFVETLNPSEHPYSLSKIHQAVDQIHKKTKYPR